MEIKHWIVENGNSVLTAVLSITGARYVARLIVKLLAQKALILLAEKDSAGNCSADLIDIAEENVMPRLTKKQKSEVKNALRLYEDFTGHAGEVITKIDKPSLPDAVAVIGRVDGIMYTAVRDGITEKYVHEFASNSRPLFCVSPDGKQLIMLGGAYDFTERGIVDSRD
jgi:hypothetical protein